MTTLDTFFDTHNTTITRDLKLNLQRLLNEGALDAKESHLALLATASSVESVSLAQAAREKLQALGVEETLIVEATESAAIVAMLNMYYRFKHMIIAGQGDVAKEAYKSAGLRMTSLAKPALGKDHFEMLAFAVSVLNGCESCINAHEQALRQAGVTVDKIHDLARLAAVVKGLKTLGLN